MLLFWTPEAFADRDAIYTYIEERNPQAALALDERFASRAAAVAGNPMMGRPGRVSGTRELVIHPNYILVYDIAGDTVRLLRVVHAARQWPPNRPE